MLAGPEALQVQIGVSTSSVFDWLCLKQQLLGLLNQPRRHRSADPRGMLVPGEADETPVLERRLRREGQEGEIRVRGFNLAMQDQRNIKVT